MKVAKFTTCLFLIGTLGFMSCNSDKKTNLNGRWELKYGELNGQPAPLLDKMYFQFDGKNVTTNFNEATTDETTPFVFKDSKIIKQSNPTMEFAVTSLTDSTLEMTTELRGFDFKLVLNHISQ
jgi:hypothetical protein